MNPNQLLGQYARLRGEWSDACESPAWHADRIERLSNAIVDVNRQLSDMQPVDEQTADSLPGLFR